MLHYINLALPAIVYGHEIQKLMLSVLAGALLGIEREIRGKSAGFRTLALICLGATLFTIGSYLLGITDNRDRMAANIITGIGFIGAGVIFRNNSSISGITTAASIWVAAALGIMIGIGEYLLAGVTVVLALLILYVMDFVQLWVDNRFQHRNYRVIFRTAMDIEQFGNEAQRLKLSLSRVKMVRTDEQLSLTFDISGKGDNLERFNHWLIDNQSILSFDW